MGEQTAGASFFVLFERQDSAVALIAATFAIAISVAAYWIRQRKTQKQPWKSVPGALPILGHIHLIPTPTLRRLPTTIEQWSDQYGTEDGCFEINLAGDRYLVICREDRLEEILKSRVPGKMERSAKVREAADCIGAVGVFSAEGKKWVMERKIVSAAFNHSSIRDYLSVQKEMTNRLVQKWKKQAKESHATMDQIIIGGHDFVRLTADTIAKVSIGQDFDFLNSPDSQIASDISRMFDMAILRSLSPVRYWRVPFIGQYLDGLGFSIDRVYKIIADVVRHEQTNLNGSFKGTKQNFLQKCLANLKTERSTLTVERLVGNIMTLFLAGTDTSGKTLGMAAFLLARDQTLQRTLRDEVDNVDLGTVTMDDLISRFPRLKSFLHETHRHYAIPFIWLKTTAEIPFYGTTLPPDTSIMVMDKYISTRKDQPSTTKVPCPNGIIPHEFDAERYLETRKDDTGSGEKLVCPTPAHSVGFGIFGYGTRACPGRLYAENQSLLVLAAILQAFELELAPGQIANPDIVYDVTMIPDGDVRLRLKSR